MKITNADRQLWMAMRAPAWLAQRTPIPTSALIDMAVNGRGKPTSPHVSEPHNTIQVLLMVRRRAGSAGLLEALTRMSVTPGCMEGKRRKSFCRKWLRRMGRPLATEIAAGVSATTECHEDNA